MKNTLLLLFALLFGYALNAQDTPCTATSVTVGASCTFSTYTNVGSTDSGIPDPSCGSYTSSGGDVWFVITVPSNGNIQLETQSGGLTDAAMAIYSGPDCNTLTEVQCDDDDGNGSMPYIFQNGLTPGTNLWIRVWDFDGNNFGTFGLCAYEYSFSAQDCPGGTTVCSDVTVSGNSSGPGDFAELTSTNDGCLDGENESSWYFFSSQTSGTVELAISPAGGTGVDYDFAIWGPFGSAACPPASAPIRCSYSSTGGDTGLASGSGDNSEGTTGDKWVNPLNVTAGEVYIMVIDNYTADGSTFDLDWTLSGGASFDCTILDVELIDFLAKQREDDVELKWATATEVKTDYFIIQRAGADGSFEDLVTVDAKGSANQKTNYSIIDPSPLLGTSYYKLLEVTQDGMVNEYKTVSVEFKSDLSFKVYPNPAKDVLNIVSYQNIEGDVEYQISDVKGVRVKNGILENNANNKISITGLNNGFYFISLINNGRIVYRDKLVKK